MYDRKFNEWACREVQAGRDPFPRRYAAEGYKWRKARVPLWRRLNIAITGIAIIVILYLFMNWSL